MDNRTIVQCEVVSDLMVLYSLGKQSEETRLVVENHLKACQACAKAFQYEPEVRKALDLSEIIPAGIQVDGVVGWLRFAGLTALEWLLYGFLGLVRLMDKLLHKFGLSTIALKIRVYRTRRRIAGVLLNEQSADLRMPVNG